jgi:hypothetical protein
MWHRSKGAALIAALAAAGCGDGGVSPGDGGGGEEIAARFELLADSVDGEGYSPTAEALRHAAEIVRLAGGATEVTLTIDGQARGFLAVAEQLDFPNIVCSWPGDTVVGPDDSVIGGPGPQPGAPGGGEGECEQVGTFSMRTLIAWEPDDLAEVVRLVADLGNTEVQPGVPDVMTGLPTGEAPADGGEPLPEPRDSAVGGYPGFIGEYLVRDVGSWWAVEGSQSNELVGAAGACTEDTVTFDWARFRCEGARFRFGLEMRVEAMRYDPATGWDPEPEPGVGAPEGSHDISLASTEIDGVRLEVVEWVPPPLPPVDPPPVDPPPVDPPPVDSTGVPVPG